MRSMVYTLVIWIRMNAFDKDVSSKTNHVRIRIEDSQSYLFWGFIDRYKPFSKNRGLKYSQLTIFIAK